jgi:hypothetical protein
LLTPHGEKPGAVGKKAFRSHPEPAINTGPNSIFIDLGEVVVHPHDEDFAIQEDHTAGVAAKGETGF